MGCYRPNTRIGYRSGEHNAVVVLMVMVSVKSLVLRSKSHVGASKRNDARLRAEKYLGK